MTKCPLSIKIVHTIIIMAIFLNFLEVLMKAKKLFHALRVAITAMMLVVFGVLFAACGDKDKAKNWPETGVYYCYDAGDEETALALSNGKKFVLTMNGESQTGTYTMTDLTLTLKFSDKSTITAAYNNTVITVTIDNVSMDFYKVIPYTVTYDAKGGSQVDAVSTVNGKTIDKPANPTQSGYEFIGWYTDSAYKTPFLFGTQKIVADTTLYARWAMSDPNAAEFDIDFNVGYNGTNPAKITTIDGKIYNVNMPTPVRDGYTFAGWAVSMYDDASKISYMFKDPMTVTENTTFHAVWTANDSSKLETPVVSVEAGAVVWNAISGVSSYKVEIYSVDASGLETYVDGTTTGATTYNYNFGDAPAGDYVVKVTAVASDTSKNSDVAVRYYLNKALSRVSHFAIDGTVVSFNAVENVTNYLLTIDCGDSNHNHTNYDLGNKTSYDFKNCIQQDGGIVFTVTSTAEGYSSVTSRAFVYEKELGAVENLTVDEATGVVTWDAVENAEKYVVSVKCGNAAHRHERVYVDGTTFSVKECENIDGGIIINVYAIAEGYNASNVASVTYNKTTLATPSVVLIDGTTMSWRAVNGATGGYKVKIGDEVISVNTNSIELSAQQIEWVEAADYVVTLQAIGANGAESLWSDDIDVRYYAMYTSISYDKGVVSWNHVIGATSYKVRVNEDDATAITVEDGANFAEIVLTKAGENKIEVCYYDGETASAWVSTTVTAYAIEFDTMVSTTTFPTQYKAVGDPTDSFDGYGLKKGGYVFYGWYKSEEVGAGNAALYVDGYFRGTSNIKLYADYTPRTYPITYDYQGGLGTPTDVNVTYNKDFTMAVPTIIDATKAFGGWYTAPGGTGTRLTDEYGKSINPWSVAVEDLPEGAEGTVAYAFWKDMVLEYKLISVAGISYQVYAVSKGARINLVNEVTVPVTYMGIPVKTLLPSAFVDCTKLHVINIPNTVDDIAAPPNSPFTGCTQLRSVNIYEVEDNNAIRYWSKDGVLFDNGIIDEQPQPTELAYFPLGYTYDPTRDKSYRVPEGVHVIPRRVFEDSLIESISISSDVTLVETDAFYDADSLITVTFEDAAENDPDATLTIEPRAFRSCGYLETVNLPKHVTEVSWTKYGVTGTSTSEPSYDNVTTSDVLYVEDSFMDCSKIKEINITDGGEIFSSKDGIVYNKNKTAIYYVPRYFQPTDSTGKYVNSFTIPASVSKIENGAFVYVYNIEKLTIPSTVTTIGDYAFYNCYYMDTLTFGGNGMAPVTIGDYAFRSCSDLRTINFESGSQVTTIGRNAFMYNYYMTSLTIPASVKVIDDQAFYGWYYLKNVTFTENLNANASLQFGNAVFYGSIITDFTIPAQCTDMGGVLSGMNKLQSVTVDSDNKNYMSDKQGVLFNKAETKVIYYPQGRTETTYTLPDSVVEIGAGVFSGNRYLTTFEIGKNITIVGDNAFYKCTALKTLTFEAGGTADLTIGMNAFRECKAITTLTLPARTVSYGAYAFSYMNRLTSLNLNEGLTKLTSYGIYENQKLPKIVVPSTVTKIEEYGISNNDVLTEIEFAKNSETNTTSITEIGYNAIYYNIALASIEIPKTVTHIRYYGLYAGSYGKLSSVTFEEGSQLEYIGPYAFYYAKKLRTIEIPKTVKRIEYYAFYQSGLTSITFEEGGTEDLYIGAYSVYKTSETSAETGNYGYVFVGTKLTDVELPARTVEIGRYCFAGVKTLESITFAGEGETSRLKQIGEFCFQNCTALEGIKIPKSVTNQPVIDLHPKYQGTNNTSYMYNANAIARYAFDGCTSLSSVVFEMGGVGELTMASYAFGGCTALTSITLPGRLVNYDGFDKEEMPPFGFSDAFIGCTNLTAINIDTTNATDKNLYVSEDGIVYTKDMTTLIYCPKGRVAPVEIPKEVTKIGDSLYCYAFKDCAKLTAVSFEAGGTAALEIGNEAFSGCASLAEIELDDRVSKINLSAFKNCTNLESIDLSADLATFDATVFAGCSKLEAVNILGNEKYVSVDGVLFDPTKEILYYYPLSKDATSYTVPASVKTINQYAFYYNSTLEEVVLPVGVQEISERAFYHCSALKRINIPKNVAKIGDYAFCYCSALESVTFDQDGATPLSIGNADQVNTSSVTSASTSYGYAFAYCYALEEIVLPARTQTIADLTFSNCRGLRSITIPANVENLGNGAFYHCERLASIDFEEGSKLTKIPYYAFGYCYSLQSFAVPASVTEFVERSNSSYAFYHCENMQSFDFGEVEIETIPQYTFAYCYALEEMTIPASVSKIKATYSSYSPFYYCTGMTSFEFEEGTQIEKLPSGLFYHCESLETFTFPKSVKEVGNNLFGYCFSINNIVVPDGILMDYGMFYYCSSLTNVTLPEDMEYMPDSMFYGCTSLSSIEFPESLTEIDYNAFGETGFVTFTIPEGVTALAGSLLYNCQNLEEVILHNGITSLSYSVFGCNPKLERVELPDSIEYMEGDIFWDCPSLSYVKLPRNENCATLGYTFFYGCTSLKSIEIPETFTMIDYGVFQNSGITSIELPDSITEIYDSAFQGCKELVSVVLPEKLSYLGYNSFLDCTKLESVTFTGNQLLEIQNEVFKNCTSLKEIELPNGIASIGGGAFANSGLTSISIPASVYDLMYTYDEWTPSYSPFAGCKNLTTIELDALNTSYEIVDGVLMDEGETEIYLILPSKTGTFTVSEDVTVKPGAFGLANLTSVELPATMKEIAPYMFYQAGEIGSVVIPEGVETVGEYAFANSGVSSVTIPTSVVLIDYYAFYKCGVETVNFTAGGTDRLKIGSNAFTNASKLKSITIPSRVRTTPDSSDVTYAISSSTFFYCTSLETVIFEDDPAVGAIDGTLNIGSQAFYGCSKLQEIHFPKAFGNGSYASGTSTYTTSAIGGSAFSKCTALTTVTFEENPDKQIKIESGVFANCTSLQNIELPSTTNYLGGAAFLNTAIRSITIPATVTDLSSGYWYDYSEDYYESYEGYEYYSINGGAFKDCKELTTVIIEANLDDSTQYVDQMFEGCTKLTSVDIRSQGFNKLGAKMFNGCTALTSFTIPTWITTTADYVFSGYTGTVNVNRTRRGTNEWSVYWNADSTANFVYNN